MSPAVTLDVATVDSWRADIAADGPVVLVEPTWGVPAVAAALDAGWSSVEVAPEVEEGAAPIPLVSFEVPVPAEHRGSGRCRVRSADLVAALDVAQADVLLGAPVNARPIASRIARTLGDAGRVTLLLAPTAEASLAADAMWASGVLLRILLEELDVHDCTLTDPAGIAVTLAQGAEDASVQLAAGGRWAGHLARGGNADDLRIAAAVDSIGAVPHVTREGDAWIARPA